MREHASTLASDAEFVEVGSKLLRGTALALYLSMHREGYQVCMVEGDDGHFQVFRSSQKSGFGVPFV